MSRLLRIKKSGRACIQFPWESSQLPKPWNDGYERVCIPLTPAERRNSNKKCHIQIVASRNLEVVKEPRYVLR